MVSVASYSVKEFKLSIPSLKSVSYTLIDNTDMTVALRQTMSL